MIFSRRAGAPMLGLRAREEAPHVSVQSRIGALRVALLSGPRAADPAPLPRGAGTKLSEPDDPVDRAVSAGRAQRHGSAVAPAAFGKGPRADRHHRQSS